VLAAAVAGAWVFNPFAAALLLPALHAWILLAAPEVQVHRTAALVVVALTLLPLALLALYYALVLGLGPLGLLWNTVLLAVRGDAGLLGALSWTVVAGCLAAVLAIVRSSRFEPPPPGRLSTRGPVTYAGPGSLGGTKSALRR
jgi:hypothetical protein